MSPTKGKETTNLDAPLSRKGEGLADRKAGYSPVAELREHRFNVVGDGGAVIVIGKRGTIPIDRPVGAMDLLSATTARRFESADDAVNVLIKQAIRQRERDAGNGETKDGNV